MMDSLMMILLLIIVIACIIFGIFITLYNKIQDFIIRIDEVESKIDTSLRNKYDHINRCVSIVKSNEKISKEIESKTFEEIVKLRNRKISNFDLYRKLKDAELEFLVINDKYDEISNNEDIKNIVKKLDDDNDKIEINIDYYNRNTTEYNKLIKLFPTNIIASICKYKERLFFDRKNMKDDDYEDFKL